MVGAITKTPRTKVRRVTAERIKAPQTGENPDTGELFHEFVYVRGGKPFKVRLNSKLKKKIKGTITQNKRHSGLYRNKDLKFFVLLDSTNQMIGIDAFPARLYGRTGAIPAGVRAAEYITIRFDKITETLHFTVIPQNTLRTENEVRKIAEAIDKVSSISPGDTFANCTVVGVAGNEILLELSGNDGDDD